MMFLDEICHPFDGKLVFSSSIFFYGLDEVVVELAKFRDDFLSYDFQS